MSDDLIERLRECAECKSSEAWGRIDGGQDLCIGAALATEAAEELARLRAEVERLLAALADERRHADALADTLYSMDGLQSIDCEMRDNAVQQHRARRQG